jgi:chromosome segregation ATPase
MSASLKGRGERSFQSSLSALESATKDVLSFTKSITTIDDLQRQKLDLQRQLDGAGVKIRELQESLNYEKRKSDDIFLKVEQLASGWAEEKTSLEARVREVTDSSQIATKKKMQELERRTKGAEENVLQCQRRLEEQIMKNRKLQAMLEESDFRLKTLNLDNAVGEVDLDEYGNQSISCEAHLLTWLQS